MAIKIKCGKGAEDLSTDDKAVLDKLSFEYSDKVARHVKNLDDLEISLKCHKKEGNAKRYSIETKFSSGKYKFETSADEWNLSDSIHKAMKKLLSEIEHNISKDKDHKNPMGKKSQW